MTLDEELAMLEAEQAEEELAMLEAEEAAEQQAGRAAGISAGIQGAMGATPMGALFNKAAPVGQLIGDAGTPAAGATLGQRIGANPNLVRMSRGASVPVMGGIGAGIGSEINRRVQGNEFELGRFAADVGTGMIPGPRLAGQTARQLAGIPGIVGATQNIVLGAGESLIDRGKLPSLGEFGMLAASGYAGPQVGRLLGKAFGGKAVEVEGKNLKPLDQSTVSRKAAASDLVDEGFVFSPNRIQNKNKPIATMAAGGEDVVEAVASETNIPLAQRLVRRQFGLEENSLPIDEALWDSVREKASNRSYVPAGRITESAQKKLDGLRKQFVNSPDVNERRIQEDLFNQKYANLITMSEGSLKRLKLAQEQIKIDRKLWQNGKKTYDDYMQSHENLAREQDKIIQSVKAARRPDLAKKLEDDKVFIRQSHVAQDASDPVAGIIEPTNFGRNIDKGEKLTGEIGKLGRAAYEFPEVFRPLRASPRTDLTVNMTQMGRDAATGNPASAIGLSFRRFIGAPARGFYITRKGAQKALVAPEYLPDAQTNPAGVFGRLGLMGAGRTQQEDPYIRQ